MVCFGSRKAWRSRREKSKGEEAPEFTGQSMHRSWDSSLALDSGRAVSRKPSNFLYEQDELAGSLGTVRSSWRDSRASASWPGPWSSSEDAPDRGG